MADPLTREDYDYILASLRYAHYAQGLTHYATVYLKHQQEACLEHMEEKLRALRDEIECPHKTKNEPELF